MDRSTTVLNTVEIGIMHIMGSLGILMDIVRSLKSLVHFERSRFQCNVRYELSNRNYSERTSFPRKLDASPKLCIIIICIITTSTVVAVSEKKKQLMFTLNG